MVLTMTPDQAKKSGPVKRPHHCSACQTWHYPGRKALEADPALGAKLPRCRTCGAPNDLLDVTLVLQGRQIGTYRLCGPCYYAANPIDPQAGDPLAA